MSQCDELLNSMVARERPLETTVTDIGIGFSDTILVAWTTSVYCNLSLNADPEWFPSASCGAD